MLTYCFWQTQGDMRFAIRSRFHELFAEYGKPLSMEKKIWKL